MGGQHDFENSSDGASSWCHLCLDTWPANIDDLCNFSRCRQCGMGAHLDCRRLAAFIQPCGQCHDISGWDSTVEERKNAGLMPVGGRLAVKLLRGFNLKNESEGAHVYGVFNIKGQLGAFSTNSAPVDSDKDVSWASKNMKKTSDCLDFDIITTIHPFRPIYMY